MQTSWQCSSYGAQMNICGNSGCLTNTTYSVSTSASLPNPVINCQSYTGYDATIACKTPFSNGPFYASMTTFTDGNCNNALSSMTYWVASSVDIFDTCAASVAQPNGVANNLYACRTYYEPTSSGVYFVEQALQTAQCNAGCTNCGTQTMYNNEGCYAIPSSSRYASYQCGDQVPAAPYQFQNLNIRYGSSYKKCYGQANTAIAIPSAIDPNVYPCVSLPGLGQFTIQCLSNASALISCQSCNSACTIPDTTVSWSNSNCTVQFMGMYLQPFCPYSRSTNGPSYIQTTVYTSATCSAASAISTATYRLSANTACNAFTQLQYNVNTNVLHTYTCTGYGCTGTCTETQTQTPNACVSYAPLPGSYVMSSFVMAPSTPSALNTASTLVTTVFPPGGTCCGANPAVTLITSGTCIPNSNAAIAYPYVSVSCVGSAVQTMGCMDMACQSQCTALVTIPSGQCEQTSVASVILQCGNTINGDSNLSENYISCPASSNSAVIGGICAGVGVLFVAVFCIVFCVRRRRANSLNSHLAGGGYYEPHRTGLGQGLLAGASL
eukprot:TRINITY_DN2891_c0_g1_i3.p1 TRINITY_DN2891_c0_g1~~TRINITY_DN2891_c0_g1_i3.p1  ORF type:complete len:552 (-),score=63.66 TRINITY_DN2891_c0_g1_i3:883-2538(-)